MMIDRRQMLTGAAAVAIAAIAGAKPAKPATVHVYKSPTCGCCAKWVERVRASGFAVEVAEVADVTAVARKLGVPDAMRSCHTSTAGGYFIEGHVPPADIARLLREKPVARGIAVPGMPMGAPGMEHGDHAERFVTLLVGKDGRGRQFAVHGG